MDKLNIGQTLAEKFLNILFKEKISSLKQRISKRKLSLCFVCGYKVPKVEYRFTISKTYHKIYNGCCDECGMFTEVTDISTNDFL
jgi:hypothetical protein